MTKRKQIKPPWILVFDPPNSNRQIGRIEWHDDCWYVYVDGRRHVGVQITQEGAIKLARDRSREGNK